MPISPKFKATVEDGDVELVRRILKNSLVVDPTAADFDQMLSYARAQSMRGIFDAHDGEKLKQNSASWTKEYMDEQMVNVVDNFSDERIELLKRICRHLYRDKIDVIEEKRRMESSSGGTVKTKVCNAVPIMIVVGLIAACIGIALITLFKGK